MRDCDEIRHEAGDAGGPGEAEPEGADPAPPEPPPPPDGVVQAVVDFVDDLVEDADAEDDDAQG